MICVSNFFNKVFYKLNLSLSILFVFLITNCVSNNLDIEYKQAKQELNSILNKFINKKPNDLYLIFGKPDNYYTITKDNKIKQAEIVYNYIYNFEEKKYDCNITFITNKEQNKIVDIKYNNYKCLYIVLY